MANPIIFPGDLVVQGTLKPTGLIPPAGSIPASAIQTAAGIETSKLTHLHQKCFSQEAATNAAAEARVIHIARFAGTLDAFSVGLITPPDTLAGSGGRTAIVDLKKNGTTILSATITLNSTAVAYVKTDATISSAAYVAGDVFTVVVTLGAGSTGTNPKGVFAQAAFNEAGV